MSLGGFGYSKTQNLPADFDNFHPKSLLRHLHFYKYIFTVNNDLKLTSVYSAARENAIISYDVVTFAEALESGDTAKEALKYKVKTNKLFESVLNKIENLF